MIDINTPLHDLVDVMSTIPTTMSRNTASETAKLSTHLLKLNPSLFQASTQSTFLRHAGNGTLPKPILSKWLTKDRLYAQSYVRWAGLLLANLKLPRLPAGKEDLNERLTDCIIGALANVKRELGFFEDAAAEYGLDLTVWDEHDGVDGQMCEGKVDLMGMGKGARGYARLFERLATGVEKGETSVLENWVLLWAMEKCYLEAWLYARSFTKDKESGSDSAEIDADGGALRNAFIPNWTGDEFVRFVDEIQGLLQELWIRDGEAVGLQAVERVWLEVLQVEMSFWPAVEDE